MALWTLRDIGNGAINPPRYWQWHSEPCMMIPVAALQREWGNLVQPLKMPTQVTPVPTAWWFSKFIPALGIHFRMGDGPIFPKTSAPRYLMTTYGTQLLSTRSISQDKYLQALLSNYEFLYKTPSEYNLFLVFLFMLTPFLSSHFSEERSEGCVR